MDRRRSKTWLASVLAVAVSLTAAACTQTGSATNEAEGSTSTAASAPTSTSITGPAEGAPEGRTGPTSTSPPVRIDGIPLQPAELVDGVQECKRMAKGPWKQMSYGTDPLAMVRAGSTPEISTASNAPLLDEIVEYPTLADYDDPSTLRDPEAVMGAFKAAGYREGVAARFLQGAEEVAVTAVRFRDPAAAQSAMSAHLNDYCERAVDSGLRPQGNGMVVHRDQDAVRSFFVLDDVEVTVFVCRCFYADAERRKLGVESWAERVEEALLAPAPNDDSA